MRLTILGSGGALVTPRPGCPCRVCTSARSSEGRHRRGGPCLYVHDAHALVDAPEDVIPLLARAGVDRVDHLLLTHWHPDHTAGFRVVEQIAFDLATGGARTCVDVWLNADTLRRRGDDWRYFERRGYCRLNVLADRATLQLGPIEARTFSYAPDSYLTGFILTDGQVRVVLVLDETRGLAAALPPEARVPDLLIAECGFFDRGADGAVTVPAHWRMRQTEASFELDTLPLVRAVAAGRTVLTHILGCLVGHTPDELDALGHELTFAHDGLDLRVTHS